IATCQLHMRRFHDGQTITVEPFRATAFPNIKDLVVDRSAFDRIISTGGYITENVGAAPDANAIPIPKDESDTAFASAACIGCGACVASCPNASASLFVSAKISQYALLPQGRPEATRRVINMIEQMDKEGFGNCSNHGECEAVCPADVPLSNIARMRREYLKSLFSFK
ncbi:MAG: succinate dehydrogenase/fumarate reductase iron-sulfur subunit, partial [FCB group bacterium]|nr:succinate dehydrogenase/fumarate reductase iron-sulfur subunit [FCB group bacterium]